MLKYLGFKSIVGLARMLPRSWQYAMAHRVADAHYILDQAARRSVQHNLRIILGPDAPDSAVRHEARWVFRSFSMYLCEFFGHEALRGSYIDRHVIVQGQEHLDAALSKGRGAIFCSAHYSNWELGATVVAHLGYPIVAVTQRHTDSRTNTMFVSQREAAGVRVVHSEHGATAALRALRRNQTVALLGDRPTGGPTVAVRLCQRRILLPQGPWRIAQSSGAALLPTFMHRRYNGNYTLEIGAPIAPPDDGRSGRMNALAQAWADCLEARLRRDPSQWAVFYPAWDVAGADARAPLPTPALGRVGMDAESPGSLREPDETAERGGR